MFANIKMFDNEISDQELKLEVRSLVHLKWEIGEICLVLFPQLGHFTAEPSRTPALESPVSKAKYWVNSRCVCAVSNKNTVTCWGLPGQSLSLSLRAHHLIGWAAWLLCEADHGECRGSGPSGLQGQGRQVCTWIHSLCEVPPTTWPARKSPARKAPSELRKLLEVGTSWEAEGARG